MTFSFFFTVDLDDRFRAHDSTKAASRTLVVLLVELRGEIALLIDLLRDKDRSLWTGLDAETTTLAHCLLYSNRPFQRWISQLVRCATADNEAGKLSNSLHYQLALRK